MIQPLHQFVRLEQYENHPILRRNVVNMLTVLPLALITAIMIALADIATNFSKNSTGLVTGIMGIALVAVALFLVRRGRVSIAAMILIAPFYIGVFLQFVLNDFAYLDTMLLVVGTILAAAINNRNGVIVASLVNFVFLFIGAAQIGITGQFAIVSISLFFSGLLSYITASSLEPILTATVAERRSQLLQTGNTVAQSVLARRELEPLLNETVSTIRDQFQQVYHAQVFLLDDARRNAVLRASTGEVGQKLIERRHTLAVGSQSVIGRVTQRGTYVLAGDTSFDPIHKRNELLPNTRTELALPLQVAEGVIGALDLQSLAPDAFSEEDIEVFQSLADQIAWAIENARLFTNTQMQLEENHELLERERRNRREIEALNNELIGTGWRNYIQISNPPLHQTINIDNGEVSIEGKFSAQSEETMQIGRLQLVRENDIQLLTMPIVIENIVIGVFEFEIPIGQVISAGIIASLETLSDSLGIVFENARLFHQARSAASREQAVSHVAAELLKALDLQQIANQAAPLFNEILSAQQTRVYLGSVDNPSGMLSDNGN